MFTYYAEIPTKNLIIEVPTFSEDQEEDSTYTTAKLDASIDFQYVAYEPSSEFQLIGQTVCDACEYDSKQEIDIPYGYEPIYSIDLELSNNVASFEDGTSSDCSLKVEMSPIKQDTTMDAFQRCARIKSNFKNSREGLQIISEGGNYLVSKNENLSKNKKLKKLFLQDLDSNSNRPNYGLRFNLPSVDNALVRKRKSFKGSQGKDYSKYGDFNKKQPLIQTEQISLSLADNYRFGDFADVIKAARPNQKSGNSANLEYVSSQKFREKLSRKKQNKESRYIDAHSIKTTKFTNVRNSRIDPYHYHYQQHLILNHKQQQNDCQILTDNYYCKSLLYNSQNFDRNLRYNLSKTVSPVDPPIKDGVALELSFFKSTRDRGLIQF